MNTFILLFSLSLLALVPCLLWVFFIFSGRKEARFILVLSFILGCLTVLPLYAMDNFSNTYPRFAMLFHPEAQWEAFFGFFHDKTTLAVLYTTAFLAFREEFVKILVLLFMDKACKAVHRVSDAVKIALLSGLGFAFIENIFYFYSIYQQGSLADLFGALVFRSLFTMSAHMVFSGILGYFYGMSHFSSAVLIFEHWTQQSQALWMKAFQKFYGLTSWVKKNMMLLVGMLWALGLHFVFNVLLHYNQIFLVMLEIILGFAYLLYLLSRKSGGLQYAESASVLKNIHPHQKVIFELLGTWMVEEKYKDVMDVCQRYLAKDPQNSLVQLFLARAMDAQRWLEIETAFSLLFESKSSIKKDNSLRGMVQRKIMMELLQGSLTKKQLASLENKEEALAWMLNIQGQTWALDSKVLGASVHPFQSEDSTKTLHMSTKTD